MKQTLDDIKLFVCTPMYGGMCAGYFTQGLLTFQNLLSQVNVRSSYSFLFNESLITRARNALAHTFLKSDCTHLFFIDADIRFHANELLGMLGHMDTCQILCGIYPKKEINWHAVQHAFKNGVPVEQVKKHTGSFVINLVGYAGEATVPMGEPAEVWNGGTGCMLIAREVFEKMAEVVPKYRNDVGDQSGQLLPAEEIAEFFTTSIEPDTRRLLSEDFHFCSTWRQMGGKVHCAPWVNLGHLGSYLFEGELIKHDDEAPAQPVPEAAQ